MTNIVVISAGISVPSSDPHPGRRPRQGRRARSFGRGSLGGRARGAASGVEPGASASYDVIELRDLAHLITDNVLTGFPTGALADAVRRVAEADASSR